MNYFSVINFQLLVPKTDLYCFSLLNNSTLSGDLSYHIRGHAQPQQMIDIDKPYCMYLNLQAGDIVQISGILSGVQKETQLKVNEGKYVFTQLKVNEGKYVFTYNFYNFVKEETNSTTQLGCSHNWKEYIGFTERYKYCTKCDSKENQ